MGNYLTGSTSKAKRCEKYANKWQIISGLCCIRNRSNKSQDDQINDINDMLNQTNVNNNSKKLSMDSTDCSKVEICYLNSPLPTQDTPNLYPPGRILHIVRQYPRNECENNRSPVSPTTKPVFQIIEADNRSFTELLISPRMLQDHMPQSILNAMKAALNDQQLSSKKPDTLINVHEINEHNRSDEICDLQPPGQKHTKFSKMKKVIFGGSQQKFVKTSVNSNRQSKALSVCSYENIIHFAPLAKQESLSDMTLYCDDGASTSLLDNSFRNSILKLRDELAEETREQEEEDEEQEANGEPKTRATSTPRNNELTSSSQVTGDDFNCTTLSQMNNNNDDHSSSLFENSSRLADDTHLTFSSNNNSINANVNNQSFLSDYSSIDKLEILKPQSNDYILCFNTSVDSSVNTSNNNEMMTGGVAATATFDSGIDMNSGCK